MWYNDLHTFVNCASTFQCGSKCKPGFLAVVMVVGAFMIALPTDSPLKLRLDTCLDVTIGNNAVTN